MPDDLRAKPLREAEAEKEVVEGRGGRRRRRLLRRKVSSSRSPFDRRHRWARAPRKPLESRPRALKEELALLAPRSRRRGRACFEFFEFFFFKVEKRRQPESLRTRRDFIFLRSGEGARHCPKQSSEGRCGQPRRREPGAGRRDDERNEEERLGPALLAAMATSKEKERERERENQDLTLSFLCFCFFQKS